MSEQQTAGERRYVRGEEVGSRRRKPRLWVAVGGVVALALGAGLTATTLNQQEAERPAPAPSAAAPAAEPVPDVPAAAPITEPAGSEPAGSEEVPTFPPNGVTWSLFKGYALPSHPQAGPRQVDGALAEGYAHTPTGALLAAANIDARVILAGSQWREVVERQVVPGPGRDLAVQVRSQVPDDAPPGDLAQIAGFRWVTYSPEVAVIDIARRGRDGTLQSAPVTVRWHEGDWRVEWPAEAEDDTREALTSLVGFAPWSGVA